MLLEGFVFDGGLVVFEIMLIVDGEMFECWCVLIYL